jgi:hypothetical protein
MSTDNSDELLLFEGVTIVRSTATALQCRIGRKVVWLPRHHVDGKLWSRGDRGQLSIRRWVARDRHLIDPHATPSASPARSGSPRGRLLHLVREDRTIHHGD